MKRLFAQHRAGRADNGNRIWRLLNLELWQRVFIDGEIPGKERELQQNLVPVAGSPTVPGAAF